MALLVWLPLNKEGLFLNQGLADITVTNNGATYNTNGKIGGTYECYSGYLKTNIKCSDLFQNGDSFSYSLWIKIILIPNGTTTDQKRGGCFGCNLYKGGGFGILLYNNGAVNAYICNNTNGDSTTFIIPNLNEWNHYTFTYNKINKQASIYINGNLIKNYTISFVWGTNNSQFWIGKNTLGGWTTDTHLCINDVRIYDHCLSPKEVHEIAKGLVLHYPMNDEYAESTTNIIGSDTCGSLSNGTWEGHTYTSVKYTITSSDPVPFTECQKHTLTYSGSGNGGSSTYLVSVPVKGNTTYCYSRYIKASDNLVYTHPNFLYRYEYANGTYVTEAGVFSNSRKKYIGNGWYRCWGVFATRPETTHLNLFFFTYPNKNVEYLLGGILLEEKDHVTPYTPTTRNEIVYDCSGYCNNGTVTGSLQVVDDSPRYKKSTKMNKGLISCLNPISNNTHTVSFWMKTLNWTPSNNNYYVINAGNGWLIYRDHDSYCHYTLSNPSESSARYSSIPITNKTEWNHICTVSTGSLSKIYVNGTLMSVDSVSLRNWGVNLFIIGPGYDDCILSDIRLYSTALSDDDIKELYNTSAWVANNGTIAAYELNEE